MRLYILFILLALKLLPAAEGGVSQVWQQQVTELKAFAEPSKQITNFLSGKPLENIYVRDSLLVLLPQLQGSQRIWALFTLGALQQKFENVEINEYWLNFEDLAQNNYAVSWVAGLKAYQLEEYDWAFRFWESCHRTLMREGWHRIPQFSLTLLRLGTRAWDSDNKILGQKLLQAALWFDPATPVTHIWQIGNKELGESGLGGLFTRVWWVISDFPSLVSDHLIKSLIFFNIFTYWQMLVYASFLVWFIFLSLSYFPLYLHRYTHFLPSSMPLFWKYFVFYCLLACLPILGFGWFLCSFLILLVVWNALSPLDKKLATLFLTLLFFAPLDILAQKAFTHPYQENSITALYQRALDEGGSIALLNSFLRAEPKGPFQTSVREVGLSIVYRKLGQYTRSMEHAKKAVVVQPLTSLAYTNMGNSFFVIGKLDEAGKIYNKSLQVRPAASTYFNLSQVYLFSNQSDQQSHYLEKAVQLDKKLLVWIEANDRLFLNSSASNSGSWPLLQKTLDVPLSLSDSFRDALEELSFHDWMSWKLPGVWFDIPALIWPLIILFFALVIVWKPLFLSSWIWDKGAVRCFSCGTLICQNCRQGAYCGHCHHQLEGVEQKSLKKELVQRLKKARSMRLHWMGCSLNLLLPGLGLAYMGQKLLGYFSFWLSSFFVISYLFAHHWAHFYPYNLAEQIRDFLLLVAITWYIIQFGLSFYMVIRAYTYKESHEQ